MSGELPEPTMGDRANAADAAWALRRAFADPRTMGRRSDAHLDYSAPRRGEWISTWANLPGFRRVNGRFQHDLLPGWDYARTEIRSEMIPDLEALAERGVRPIQATAA